MTYEEKVTQCLEEAERLLRVAGKRSTVLASNAVTGEAQGWIALANAYAELGKTVGYVRVMKVNQNREQNRE